MRWICSWWGRTQSIGICRNVSRQSKILVIRWIAGVPNMYSYQAADDQKKQPANCFSRNWYWNSSTPLFEYTSLSNIILGTSKSKTKINEISPQKTPGALRRWKQHTAAFEKGVKINASNDFPTSKFRCWTWDIRLRARISRGNIRSTFRGSDTRVRIIMWNECVVWSARVWKRDQSYSTGWSLCNNRVRVFHFPSFVKK